MVGIYESLKAYFENTPNPINGNKDIAPVGTSLSGLFHALFLPYKAAKC
jgi:hypothetical protein